MSRPKKKHAPLPASFNEVLGAIGTSKYKDKKTLKKKRKKV